MITEKDSFVKLIIGSHIVYPRPQVVKGFFSFFGKTYLLPYYLNLRNPARREYVRRPPPFLEPLQKETRICACLHRETEIHSTVTDFARFRGLSMSQPRNTAIWYAKSCNGMILRIGVNISNVSGM